jgi:hypothetical protein
VVDPHRQVRHQRALDVSHDLLGRELCGRQNMYLFYRSTVALYDFRGDHSRKRQNQLLGTLNREYAASDVIQIQFLSRDLMTD